MTIQKLASSWIVSASWEWGLVGACWRIKALFRRVLVTQIQASFAQSHARGIGDKSRSGGGWGGTLDQRETPQTSPQSSICSSHNLLPACHFVIAASYTFLSTLALPGSLLLLHRVGEKKSPHACSQSVGLNRGALEVCWWKRAASTVWRAVGIITGLYTSSGSSGWVFSADNFNIKFTLSRCPRKWLWQQKAKICLLYVFLVKS